MDKIRAVIKQSGTLSSNIQGTQSISGSLVGSPTYYTKAQIDAFRSEDREYVDSQDTILEGKIDESGHKILLTLSNRILTTSLLDANDNVISISSVELDEDQDKYIDRAEYDSQTQSIIFYYNDGTSFSVSISSVISSLETLISTEENRAIGVEAGLSNRITSIENDYLTSTDKTELETAISNEENRAEGVEDALSNRITSLENAGYITQDINTINTYYQYTTNSNKNELSTSTDWQEINTPTLNQLKSCCYGKNTYLACGLNGVALSSIDGISWNSLNQFTNDSIVDCVFGDGKFLAITHINRLYMTLTPNKFWTLVKTFDVSFNKIKYVNNTFVALGNNGYLAYSIDGITWKETNINYNYNLNDITYNNTKYIVVGSNGFIGLSYNLIDWEDISIPNYNETFTTTTFFNNMLFVAGKHIKYSTNLLNWTNSTLPDVITGYAENFAFGENRLYVVLYEEDSSGNIWTSKDGITFTNEYSTGGRLWDICYANDVFVSVGDNGTIYGLNLGITWSNIRPILVSGEFLWIRSVIVLNNGDELFTDAVLNYIPDKISDLMNDVGYITKDVNDLENYYNIPTTDNLLDEKEDIMSDITNSDIDNLFN